MLKYLIFIQDMQFGDTATLISVLLKSIRIKEGHFIENGK